MATSAEVAAAWVSAFPEGGEPFRAIVHPDLEWFPFEDDHSPSHGLDGALRVREEWLASWEQMEAEVEETQENGRDVVVGLHVMGRGRASGVEVDVRLFLHFTIRDGRVVYLYEHVDRAQALEAAGLS